MKTNIHNSFFLQTLQMIPTLAFIAAASTPQYTLAFSEQSAMGAPFAFQANYILLHEPQLSSPAFPAGSMLEVTVTAYSSTLEQTDGDPFTTASGTHVRPGVAAANFLPIGTRVQLGSYVYTIEDRTSSRYTGSYRMDIWMPSTNEARAFGVQRHALEVISTPQ